MVKRIPIRAAGDLPWWSDSVSSDEVAYDWGDRRKNSLKIAGTVQDVKMVMSALQGLDLIASIPLSSCSSSVHND
jgi:hypothetical protein